MDHRGGGAAGGDRDWWAAVAALQERLEDLSGFAGLLPDGGSITLAWKGELPQAARAALAALPRDVAVDVRPARYDLAELLAAADALLAHPADTVTSPEVVGVTPRADGSGLDVEVLIRDGAGRLSPADVVLPADVPYSVEIVSDLPRSTGAAPRGRQREDPS